LLNPWNGEEHLTFRPSDLQKFEREVKLYLDKAHEIGFTKEAVDTRDLIFRAMK
jgi:hypothetical protein